MISSAAISSWRTTREERMEPYRVFISSIMNGSIEDLVGEREAVRFAVEHFAPITTAWAFEATLTPWSSTSPRYGYGRICDLYRRWLKKLDLVLRQEHRAGEKMFVDYAGGMGEVYKVLDTKLDRDVTVKVLPAALASEPDRLAHFECPSQGPGVANHSGIAA